MTAQSEGAVALTMALGEMIRAVAEAPLATRDLLATCYRCRNSVLYLLDTVPYAGNGDTMFQRRIAALAPNHRISHEGVREPGSGDDRTPVIRGLA
jgi:hypothetical protein